MRCLLLATRPRAVPIPIPAVRRYATKQDPRSSLIRIANATFYRNYPGQHDDDSSNPPLFPDLNFDLPTNATPKEHWAILSTSSANRTAFLQILRGQYLCIPPTARSYPYLSTRNATGKDSRLRNPSHAIQYVGFDADRGGLGGTSTKGAYMSARYESLREVTDWSLLDYLTGNTELNADESLATRVPKARALRVMRDLNLDSLKDMPVSHLSNGQTRRARIAKALLAQPDLLLLDAPFMGLDPITLTSLSSLLHGLADKQEPRILLSLRPQDFIPDWITHLIIVGSEPRVSVMGSRREVFEFLRDYYVKAEATQIEFRTAYFELMGRDKPLIGRHDQDKSHMVDVVTDRSKTDELLSLFDIARKLQAKGDFDEFAPDPAQASRMRHKLRNPKPIYAEQKTRDGIPWFYRPNREPEEQPALEEPEEQVALGEALIEMSGVQIKYNDSDKAVLGDCEGGLSWEVRRGQRWAVLGPNGSGKTTLLSLITSDHPQTYSAPVKLFGRSRLPTPGTPGISIFELQARMGHSSPEVHTYFPKHLSVRRVLESAWADTPLSKPRLNHDEDSKVDACLRWFRAELHPDACDTLDQRGESFCFTRKSAAAERVPFYVDITATTVRDEERLLQPGLDWADTVRFRDLSFSSQRVALFLRAIIKSPDLVVLDEAFSGMDELVRDKCLLFLNHGEKMMLRHVYREKPLLRPAGAAPWTSFLSDIGHIRFAGLQPEQALVVVTHNRDELPNCVREYLTLPESGLGKPPLVGRLTGPPSIDWRRWSEMWGLDINLGRKKIQLDETDRERREAIIGAGSPIEIYSKSLNVMTDICGLSSLSKENAKKRKEKEKKEKEKKKKEGGESLDGEGAEEAVEEAEGEEVGEKANEEANEEVKEVKKKKKPGRLVRTSKEEAKEEVNEEVKEVKKKKLGRPAGISRKLKK